MPVQAAGLGVESDVRQQAQGGGHLLLVAPDLVALGVIAAPAQIGRKRVTVEVVGRVDAGLGIGVLEPGAAQLGVLVDHLEGDGQLLQAVGRAQARETGAYHQHPKAVAARRWRTVLPVQLAVDKAHLLHRHRHVFGRQRLAKTAAHHGLQALGIGCGRQLALATGQLVQHLGQGLAHGSLRLGRQAATELGEDRHIALGAQGRCQPARVLRDLRQTHQQGGHRGLGQRGVAQCVGAGGWAHAGE